MALMKIFTNSNIRFAWKTVLPQESRVVTINNSACLTVEFQPTILIKYFIGKKT